METKKRSISWVVVILLLMFFWPLGLVMLSKKLSEDKAAVLKKGTSLNISAGVFIVFGIYYFITATLDSKFSIEEIMIGVVFFGGGTVLLLYAANRVKVAAKKYKSYITIVINNQETSLENIASAMSLRYEQVKKDLQIMIDKGFFTNAYIDHGSHEIRFSQQQNDATYTEIGKTIMRVVVCKSCGANNKVKVGKINECEYCGSPLIID